MNRAMIPIEILGLKKDLQTAIHTLRDLGCVQIDPLSETPEISARPLILDRETLKNQEQISFLLARIGGLLDALGGVKTIQSAVPSTHEIDEIRSAIDRLVPQIQALVTRREKLLAEQASLPRYEATLRKLLPIIPAAARQPGNGSIGVLFSQTHLGILDSVAKHILEMTNGKAEVVASDIDSSTRAMLIVFPQEFTSEIEMLLSHEDISRLRLPEELGEGPPDVVLATLQRRMVAIPAEIQIINREVAQLAGEWSEKLAAWQSYLQDEIETAQVLPRLGETDLTFVLAGWIPANQLERVKSALVEAIGQAVLVEPLPLTPEMKKRAPVLLNNPAPARPFESLVNLLAIPRYGHLDPTSLMALFLPFFFGMILGDVGYGLLLLGISLVAMRKFKQGVVRDVLVVLAMGSGWAILFGFLYGEAFGTLGEKFGLHALLLDRASPDDVKYLLIMTLAVGSAHITLGLVLGLWEAWKDKSRGHLLERGGMLLGLVCLFMIVGILANLLPHGFMTPAIAGLILGIVFLGASLGWLGILMGPIEFIGLIGNILSYLRIAAIGLASLYLAKVANEIAGLVGNLIVGIILAVLIHSLNLVLGAFSPTIHSLRLHYVEFFRKFYEGGGKPYKPFRRRFGPDQSLTT